MENITSNPLTLQVNEAAGLDLKPKDNFSNRLRDNNAKELFYLYEKQVTLTMSPT